ncbi:MAG: HAD family hydrolase [Clostridia bacterium]
MIKLVASDLDGTIIDKNNKINEENFKAINKINSNGLDFVICTGKTYPIVKDICNEFNANYGIFGNGNQIIDLKTDKVIYTSFLSQHELNTSIEIAKANNLHIHIYTNNDIITENLAYMDLRNYKLYEENPSINFTIVDDIQKYIINNKINVSQLIISSDNSLEDVKSNIAKKINVSMHLIKKRGIYKDFIIDKEYEYLDISPKKTNKNTALNILGNYLNINRSEMMSVGDNLNDYDMIKNSGIGVAVANSYDDLKSVAKYVTKNNVENAGFAEAIYKFL